MCFFDNFLTTLKRCFHFWSEWRDVVRIMDGSFYSADAEFSSQPLFFLSASSHARVVCSVVNALPTTRCRYQLSRYPLRVQVPFNLRPKEKESHLRETLSLLVGVAGLEPAASSSRTKHATKLRYTPKNTLIPNHYTI